MLFRSRQILVNLVGNAVKFTSSGEVTLTVKRFSGSGEAPSLHFAVRDTGCGIPADRLDRLFRPFSQVDASTTRRYGGTGLGLVISKKLTEIMGGQIWLESEADKGSVFQFIIPLHTAPSQEPLQGADAGWSGAPIRSATKCGMLMRILATRLSSGPTGIFPASCCGSTPYWSPMRAGSAGGCCSGTSMRSPLR